MDNKRVMKVVYLSHPMMFRFKYSDGTIEDVPCEFYETPDLHMGMNRLTRSQLDDMLDSVAEQEEKGMRGTIDWELLLKTWRKDVA